ncbi:MAG: helix-turn-helix transcriptional regulator [Ruminococcaceae bacterium]|nr:helix-turn-helix transcriptional regulator [Oscillospiraceae bacterium]
MNEDSFSFRLSDDVIFYSASLRKGRPYISKYPRDHESIFIVTSGSLLYERQGVRQIIRRGQVGYVSRGSIDKSSAYGADEVSYISSKFNVCQNADFATLPFDVLCSKGGAANYEKLFALAHTTFISKPKGYLTVCNGLLLQIIGYLYAEKTDKGVAQRISPAIELINERYSDAQLRVSELADACGMSVKNFRRVFFDNKGMNPYEYLQKFRVNKAETLLLNTSESVTDIALSCGFSDVYSFSHSFRKNSGVSPISFRISQI